MKFICILVSALCLFSTFANAAVESDADRAARQAAAREAYAQQQYGKSVAQMQETSVSGGTATTKYNGSGSVGGSAMGSSSTASKAVNAALAAGQLAKRFGSGLARGLPSAIVGGLAVQGIISGVGWIIDEGSKTIKKPSTDGVSCSTDVSQCSSFAKLWVAQVIKNGVAVATYFTTPDLACNASNSRTDLYVKTVTISSDNKTAQCALYYSSSGSYSGTNIVTYEVNPNYSSIALTPMVIASTQDLANLLQKYLNDHPNTTITNNLYEAAYTKDTNNDDDNSLADRIADGIKQGLSDAAKSDTGKATTTYTDKDGQTATINTTINNNGTTVNNTSNTTTTTNEDGSTTTTTTGSSEIPPFCDWASAVCDWFKWTKEEPDAPTDQQDQEPDQSIFSRTFNTIFSLPASCPPDIPFTLDNPYLKVNDTISLKWLCIIFTFMGYPLVFISHCAGIWILYETVIRRELRIN